MFLAISGLYQAQHCHIKIADEVVATVIIFLTTRPALCDSQILGGQHGLMVLCWSVASTEQLLLQTNCVSLTAGED